MARRLPGPRLQRLRFAVVAAVLELSVAALRLPRAARAVAFVDDEHADDEEDDEAAGDRSYVITELRNMMESFFMMVARSRIRFLTLKLTRLEDT